MRISNHSKIRMKERDIEVSSAIEAKRVAKQAFTSGKTINHFQKYPKFFSYLQNKKSQSNECKIRVYRDNIYIWRGKAKTLVTVHTIPDRYLEEMEGQE